MTVPRDHGTVLAVTGDGGKSVQTTVWLPRHMRERLRESAFRARLTQSQIVREALVMWWSREVSEDAR